MSELHRRTVVGAGATGLALGLVATGTPGPAAATATTTSAAAPRFTSQAALYRRARFAKRRNAAFRVTGAGVGISMRLVAVTDLSSGAAPGSPRSFELTFRTPRRGPEQGTYTLTRGRFAATSLFLVPTDVSRRTYRAVVNNR